MKHRTLLFTVCFASLLASSSLAEIKEKAKLTGSIGIGAMVINSGNNLNPKSSERYITDLNSSAEKSTTFLPVPLPALTYDAGEPGFASLYLNTRPPIDEVGGFVINTGGVYQFTDIGIFDFGLFLAPFGEVWENPYLTGADRQDTSILRYGAKMALNRVMDTGLRLNAVWLRDDVDQDTIGELEPTLARDGNIYALNANYSFYLSKFFEIRPRISIRKGEYDGDSNSFTKYKFDLEARYSTGRLTYLPRVYYSRSEYDEINPVFNTTREEDGYGLRLMVDYRKPFGWNDWSFQGIIGYSKGDSNITFFDTESINIGCYFTYAFAIK